MACEQWTDKLDAYLDGELPENEEQALRKHLRECPDCAADVLERMEMKRSIRAEGMRFRPDPAFRARIERKISGRGMRYGWQWQTALAFAACVLVLAVLWTNHFRTRTREQQLIGELVDLHVATLASSNPVDVVSTDRHTVKPWFEGKLPFTFDLPDLTGSEFSLVGGRTAYLNQSIGAELIFKIRQHNISVFIFQERAAETCGATNLTSKFNFHVESWSRNGLCYFVLGDVNQEELGKLAALMKG